MDAESCVKSILEDNWMHPADAYDSSNSVNQPIIYKANTFLASSCASLVCLFLIDSLNCFFILAAFHFSSFDLFTARLDDIRMLKVKLTDNGKFQRGFYSVSDREKMMGFPVGYVENIGKKYFLLLRNPTEIVEASEINLHIADE